VYNKPRGQAYYGFLKQLHEELLFDWYMEIGCRKGTSFAPVRSKTIAVDPFFRAKVNIIGNKPALHVFQSTSDDFFASGFLGKNGIRIGLSFLDGMHLFEYLLRDVMGTEANSDPKGVIMLHDCVPYNSRITSRDPKKLPWEGWTGDVWKLIPILKTYRPDLKLTVLDCSPTGILCVSNLSPGNRVLQDHYDEILAEFAPLEIEAYGVARFFGAFEFTSGAEVARDGFRLFQPAAIDPALALNPIKLST
jgi:hypothetical protein